MKHPLWQLSAGRNCSVTFRAATADDAKRIFLADYVGKWFTLDDVTATPIEYDYGDNPGSRFD